MFRLSHARILATGTVLVITLAACGGSQPSSSASTACSSANAPAPAGAAQVAAAPGAALNQNAAAEQPLGATQKTAVGQVKIGLVTDIGGLNDKSFNHLAYVGLTKAVSDLGVKGDVKESHTGNDYVPNLTAFASQGYDLVIGVGFLMQQAVGSVSGQFPNVHFAIVDGHGTDANFNDLHHPNVEALLFKEQESGALVGAVAALLEKDGKTAKHKDTIGAVGGQKIPPVDHYIAGYKWAAQMEDPGICVLVGYSNDFTDPAKCTGVTNSQIGKGADVEFQVAGGCGLGVLQTAGQKGVYSIGVDADQKDADSSVIASAVKRVDVAVYTAINDVKNGNFKGGDATFSLQNGGTGYQLDNITLTSSEQSKVADLMNKIKTGALTPPAVVP
jgi:basic membrane protein A